MLAGRAIQLLNSFGWSIVLIRRFGLTMVGTFAIGFIAVTILSTASPIGLPSFLPRVRQPHARLCFAGMALHLAVLPVILAVLLGYSRLFAQSAMEARIIFLVGLSGVAIGVCNTGLMLSIMLRRFYPAAIAPLIETVAILITACGAASPDSAAGYMLMSRVGGALVVWAGMRMSVMSRRRLIYVLRKSARYLAPDAIAICSEQAAPFILQLCVSRAELGLFRLCQQMLNASDTPGWTYVQSQYPNLVYGSRRFFGSVRRAVGIIAMIASVLFAAGGTVLAIWVYHLPAIVGMVCLLSASLFWRYKINLYDQGFRASGQVASSTILGSLKCAVGIILLFFMIRWEGVWGAIGGLTILSVAAGCVYEWVYDRPELMARATS